jgi:1-acyl-sn-glycerol-3-phosphate acyltransferase
MAREYFEYKLMRGFFGTMGVILVDRAGHDLSATRAAMRTLKAGYVLGVFPEGKIGIGRELLPFQSGIGLIALKTRAPVYPAFLDGSQREKGMLEAFFRPGWARITYGEPVELGDLEDSKTGVLEATRRIREAVEECGGVKSVKV